MNAELVMFGIDAGIKLGKKLNDVLVDSAFEGPLLLPVGELFGNVTEDDAIDFFDDHPELTSAEMPYHGLSRANRLTAYLTLRQINMRVVGSGGVSPEAIEIVSQLQRFRQYEESFGAKPAAQRVVGTIVEIAIDYFVSHPEAIGIKSSERKILQAFVESLDDVNFAEGEHDQIISDVLVAAMETLQSNTSLVADSARTQALVGGITEALLADIRSAGSLGAVVRRENFVRRIGPSILRGGAKAFSDNIDLFLPNDTNSRKLVSSTLTHVLTGITGKEDLFTNESLELLFDGALKAVAENVALVSDNLIVQELISGTLLVLTDATGKQVFSRETASAVLVKALTITAQNIETLIDPTNPEKQLLANATKAVAQSLSGSLAGGGTVKDLLSHQQIISLMGVVFEEVAKHPEQLLGDAEIGDRKAALAQTIGSLARALGEEPERLINGEGFVTLIDIALKTAAKNADKLLDLNTMSTQNNVLFKAIQQTVDAIGETGDSRKLLSRDVFLDLMKRILPVVSANIDGFIEAPEAVYDAVGTTLQLANGSLEGRINGENLPRLTTGLLVKVLWTELDLTESTAVTQSAIGVLKAA